MEDKARKGRRQETSKGIRANRRREVRRGKERKVGL